ncbi:MAG TPA: phosphonate ABC transporter, permease protein PhnE [candidate division Zixibacteria bacterium]|nr:phosphonate ABC transporter, permease protein PhnE [candidate division Zixibacteria bacterium]
MTVATAQPGGRPARPRPSLAVPIGLLAFVAVTWASASEQFGIGLEVGDLIADIGRGAEIIADLFNPDWEFLPQTVGPMVETFQMAVLASVLGCAVALLVAFLASRVTAPNAPVFLAARTVLSVVRAIPDILYALVFVAAAGIGPLAGIAALTFFNIGVVAKLLSETVDGVDTGPIEAARAAGGNRLQTVRWSVLPQVLPNYVAYSLYTFELNIRASTVIGIVGAGGIGYLLQTQYRFFAWERVSVIIIELFVFVFLIELLSIWLRRRLV